MKDIGPFNDWLRRQGADVIAPTNQYELTRFRAQGAVHVIYRDASGDVSSLGEFAARCLRAWKTGANLPMGFTGRRKTLSGKIKATLLERDGTLCFFCQRIMPPSDITIEHLVAIGKGGPNHSDNYALAHDECNKAADNMPLMNKIRFHREAWARQRMESLTEKNNET